MGSYDTQPELIHTPHSVNCLNLKNLHEAIQYRRLLSMHFCKKSDFCRYSTSTWNWHIVFNHFELVSPAGIKQVKHIVCLLGKQALP